LAAAQATALITKYQIQGACWTENRFIDPFLRPALALSFPDTAKFGIAENMGCQPNIAPVLDDLAWGFKTHAGRFSKSPKS